MTSPHIFGMQFALNLIVYALIARSYIAPRLAALPLQAALTPLLLFHTLRTVGMVFVVGAVVDPKLPRDFAVGAAYGDLLAVLLALAALAALRAYLRGALALVWVFTIEGTTVSMVILLPQHGGQLGPDVLVGWQNRFMVVAYTAWLLAAAWCALRVRATQT